MKYNTKMRKTKNTLYSKVKHRQKLNNYTFECTNVLLFTGLSYMLYRTIQILFKIALAILDRCSPP